ncbi:unnamed protein product [Staurois parvus]|uniref:Uncharacterized protein n=1 Tax=Staurois parvus TaxID=386267 RepID=A0ABN9ELN9_9NEOB|nr:unnamed protein product [Staurois parvus]
MTVISMYRRGVWRYDSDQYVRERSVWGVYDSDQYVRERSCGSGTPSPCTV